MPEDEEEQDEFEEKEKVNYEGSMIADANKAAARLEAANARQEELLRKHESIMAASRLSGKTQAGEPFLKKEDTPEEYAKKVMSNDL